MKVKTKDLIGPALDWAVAKCEGLHVLDAMRRPLVDGVAWASDTGKYSPSTDWDQGGPIIERLIVEGLWLQSHPEYPEKFLATMDHYLTKFYGPTALIAAMRCYVASKLGEEIDIPEELT